MMSVIFGQFCMSYLRSQWGECTSGIWFRWYRCETMGRQRSQTCPIYTHCSTKGEISYMYSAGTSVYTSFVRGATQTSQKVNIVSWGHFQLYSTYQLFHWGPWMVCAYAEYSLANSVNIWVFFDWNKALFRLGDLS